MGQYLREELCDKSTKKIQIQMCTLNFKIFASRFVCVHIYPFRVCFSSSSCLAFTFHLSDGAHTDLKISHNTGNKQASSVQWLEHFLEVPVQLSLSLQSRVLCAYQHDSGEDLAKDDRKRKYRSCCNYSEGNSCKG